MAAPTRLRSRRAVARAFGAAAQSYDQHATLQREVADRLLRQVPALPAGASVLDLGSGTGYCTRWLNRHRADAFITALDLALPMLVHPAYRDCAGVRVCADAEALPIRAASIDLVVSSLTIQWCHDPEALFRELRRVLRPGGRILLATFGPASLQELRAAWAGVDTYTHVNDFVPAAALADAARSQGLEVDCDGERRVGRYESLQSLARDLKGIGAHHMQQGQAPGLTSPGRFRRAAEQFAGGREADGLIPVTWEILYLQLGLGERTHGRSAR